MWLLLFCIATLMAAPGCRREAVAPVTEPWDEGWGAPQRVIVKGYDGNIMEPFISRDNRWLLFNNLNAKPENTNLHWAERVDDLHFRYRGEIAGVNSDALEGVPTLDRDGNLYFVSPRSYKETLSLIHHAKWTDGVARDVALVPGLSELKPGRIQFDTEISADGDTLYSVDSSFGLFGIGGPKSADLFIASRHDGSWARDPRSAGILQEINTPDHLEYAAAISADGLTLYFNRVATPLGSDSNPRIWVARRGAVGQPFGLPRCIRAIDGFVEGATVAPGDRTIYYHKKENGCFVLYRISRITDD